MNTTDRIFKCEMIYTSNDVFRYKIGSQGLGQFKDTVFWFNDFHTSYIIKIEKQNNILTLETRNSIYKFELFEEIDILDWQITEERHNGFEKILKGRK